MRVWPCNLCGKCFQSYRNVFFHRQTHSGIHPFICRKDFCHKAFSTVSEYQAHYRWHLNIRPQQCRKCRKKFLHRNHFRLHRCGYIPRKRYSCHVCQQTFKEILSLSYHLRKKHPKEKNARDKPCAKATSLKTKDAQDVKIKKADNKILLKITAGKSMTIISPSKTSSRTKKKKNKVKKSKQKHKDHSQKNGIILSIKKGSIKLSSENSKETKLQASKQVLCKFNGLVNRVVESCNKGSNLKMKIKTLPEKSASIIESENFNRYSYPSSPANVKRSKKVPAKCSSDPESNNTSVLYDNIVEEPRVRNGIVIVKDKSGKLLAEQLQSAKAKKRENVFDSFSEVGMWKVLPSPRHDSLEALKLRLSPQKPLRPDSGIDLSCEKTKYLDEALSLKSQKLDNYSEDLNVFESLPGVKDLDTGMQNVNDSGIEILSSSSCNRSNGNSVRSVLLDDNSPTYFQTEDSLLSLDSPGIDLQLRTDHTVCPKCGGIVMETNNNAHSPRKCHCSASLVNSPTQAPSPVKLATNMSSQDYCTTSSRDTRLENREKITCDNESDSEMNSNDSDSDDSDIMFINDKTNQSEKVSEYDEVEIIRDVSNSDNRSQNNLKLRLKLKTKRSSVSNNMQEVTVGNVKVDPVVYTEMDAESFSCESDQQILHSECKQEESETIATSSIVSGVSFVSGSEVSPVLIIDSDSDTDKGCKAAKMQPLTENLKNNDVNDEHLIKEVKKKPLFKVKKKSVNSEGACCGQNTDKVDVDTAENSSKECVANINQTNNVRKKKPIFKKRSISGDSTSEICTKTDISLKSENESKFNTSTDQLRIECSDEQMKSDMLSTKSKVNPILAKENQQIYSNDLENLNITTNLKPEVETISVSEINQVYSKDSDKLTDTINSKSEVKHSALSEIKQKHSEDSEKLTNAENSKSGVENSVQSENKQEYSKHLDNSKSEAKTSAQRENKQEHSKQHLNNSKSEVKTSAQGENKQEHSKHSEKLTNTDKSKSEIKTSAQSENEQINSKHSEKVNKLNSKSEVKTNAPTEIEQVHNKDSENITITEAPQLTLVCHGLATDDKRLKVEDDDSLMQVPKLENKIQSTNTTTKKSCTSPLDLFQQQFLSFLSSNRPPCSDGKIKEQNVNGKDKSIDSETVNVNEKDSNEMPKNMGKTKVQPDSTDEKQQEIDYLKKNIAGTNKASIDKKEKLSLKRPKQANTGLKPLNPNKKTKLKAGNSGNQTKVRREKEALDKNKLDGKVKKTKKDANLEKQITEKDQVDTNEIVVKESTKNKVTDPSVDKNTEQKHDPFKFDFFNTSIKTSKTDLSHLETRTDSLSWLKIFSESIENKSAANKADGNLSEEITDFSADLAAINKKMDVSDDELLNALDVDDVFKSSNLASLQPKRITNTGDKKNKVETKRPQKAKRTKGPLKRNRIISDSESECSNSSLNSAAVNTKTNKDCDPDFNPYHDSDGDFDMASLKCKEKGSKRIRHKKQLLDFISDSDSELPESQLHTNDEIGQPSRNKRLKQGLKSCCPCCLGSPKKISRDFHQHHQYKLPKNSKQFVKSSMKLLELQAKIHQLFLSLFPDCAEFISCSKIGTEEFEILIEEVLSSLEGKEISFESSAIDHTHGCMEGLYDCQTAPFYNTLYSPHHSTVGSGCLQTQSAFYQCCKVSNCSENKGHDSCRESECSKIKFSPDHDNVCLSERAFKDLHNHNPEFETVVGSIVNPCTSMTGALHSNDTPTTVTSNNFPQESCTKFQPILSTERSWNDMESVSCEDPSELSAFDGLDSDITITIDLNAAKVSLCRDPKNCLEKLHNKISRLVQCLLPKLKLRKPFFKNIDNLHFLLDLMINTNLPGSSIEELSSSDGEMDYKLKHSSKATQGKYKIKDHHMPDSDNFTNILSKSNGQSESEAKMGKNSSEERVPLLSQFQDMFEQEIKSHRESLKKDVFELDPISERGDPSSLFKAKQVLTTISKFEKMNKAKQRLRPRRDPRLRKRSEAETRKLFVQEKIQNNQNSTIVTMCHSSPKKTKRPVGRPRLKNRNTHNSKVSFLSKLDLGGVSQKGNNAGSKNETLPSDPPVLLKSSHKGHDVASDNEAENNEVAIKDKIIENEKVTENNDNENLTNSSNGKKPATEDSLITTEHSQNDTIDLESNAALDTKKVESVVGELITENKVTNSKIYHKKNDIESAEANHDLSSTSSDVKSESSPENSENSTRTEDSDSRQKSGEKNIFELMQPS